MALTDEEKLGLALAAGVELDFSGWHAEGDVAVGYLTTKNPCQFVQHPDGSWTVIQRCSHHVTVTGIS